MNPASQDVARMLAAEAMVKGWQLGVAESLTCGRILSTLGAGPDASEWLAGGLVAYSSRIKFDLLHVDVGPVITRSCAQQMATGVADLLNADAAIAVTGCGGPDPEEGKAPGTVFVATWVKGGVVSREFLFDGTPEQVLASTVECALKLLHDEVRLFQVDGAG